jgi:hypothetical protein
MAENDNLISEQDRGRINLEEKHEVRHWSKKFGVSADRLREAVGKVGPMVRDVERELGGAANRGAPGRDASSH